MALILQFSVADWPGAIGSEYCVRCGDQSSGSTTSPALFRLMMFIATMRGGVAAVPLLVTTVLYISGVPARTVFAVTSIDTCNWASAICAAGAGSWLRAKAGVAYDRRETRRIATVARALGPKMRRVFPASRRRSGPAYQNSRPNVSTANPRGDNSQDHARASVQLFTNRLERKYLGAASGLIHWPK